MKKLLAIFFAIFASGSLLAPPKPTAKARPATATSADLAAAMFGSVETEPYGDLGALIDDSRAVLGEQIAQLKNEKGSYFCGRAKALRASALAMPVPDAKAKSDKRCFCTMALATCQIFNDDFRQFIPQEHVKALLCICLCENAVRRGIRFGAADIYNHLISNDAPLFSDTTTVTDAVNVLLDVRTVPAPAAAAPVIDPDAAADEFMAQHGGDPRVVGAALGAPAAAAPPARRTTGSRCFAVKCGGGGPCTVTAPPERPTDLAQCFSFTIGDGVVPDEAELASLDREVVALIHAAHGLVGVGQKYCQRTVDALRRHRDATSRVSRLISLADAECAVVDTQTCRASGLAVDTCQAKRARCAYWPNVFSRACSEAVNILHVAVDNHNALLAVSLACALDDMLVGAMIEAATCRGAAAIADWHYAKYFYAAHRVFAGAQEAIRADCAAALGLDGGPAAGATAGGKKKKPAAAAASAAPAPVDADPDAEVATTLAAAAACPLPDSPQIRPVPAPAPLPASDPLPPATSLPPADPPEASGASPTHEVAGLLGAHAGARAPAQKPKGKNKGAGRLRAAVVAPLPAGSAHANDAAEPWTVVRGGGAMTAPPSADGVDALPLPAVDAAATPEPCAVAAVAAPRRPKMSTRQFVDEQGYDTYFVDVNVEWVAAGGKARHKKACQCDRVLQGIMTLACGDVIYLDNSHDRQDPHIEVFDVAGRAKDVLDLHFRSMRGKRDAALREGRTISISGSRMVCAAMPATAAASPSPLGTGSGGPPSSLVTPAPTMTPSGASPSPGTWASLAGAGASPEPGGV